MKNNDFSVSLYVGTYRKYNEGSLFGEWLDLTDYTDAEEFLEACRELHKDEADPELMFQDCEGLPDSLYCESCRTSEIRKKIYNCIKNNYRYMSRSPAARHTHYSAFTAPESFEGTPVSNFLLFP